MDPMKINQELEENQNLQIELDVIYLAKYLNNAENRK